MSRRSGHALDVRSRRNPVTSTGAWNCNSVRYTSPGFKGVVKGTPLLAVRGQRLPCSSRRVMVRGFGVRGTYFGRQEEIVVSSKRVRNVMVYVFARPVSSALTLTTE